MMFLRSFEGLDGTNYALMHDTKDDSRTVVKLSDTENIPLLRIDSSLRVYCPGAVKVGNLTSHSGNGEWAFINDDGDRMPLDIPVNDYDSVSLELAECEAAKRILSWG
jgi:hypothetical protein